MRKLISIVLVIVILTSSLMLTSCDTVKVISGLGNIFKFLQPLVDDHIHTEGTIPAVESTCTEHGLTEGKYCLTCGDILVEQREIPLKPHVEGIIPAIESTCTEHGKSEGKYCIPCGAIITQQQSTPLKAHTYDDDNDEQCNFCEYERDVRCDHSNIETLEAIDSSCTQTGLTAGAKCMDCGETLVAQETISLKDHIESDWIVDEEPTLESEGLKHTECTECQVVMALAPIPQLVWVEVDSGSFEFATFPSGFWKENSIYTSMQKEAYTEYETETTKRVVSVQKAGFVYWHWMYALSGSYTAGDRVIYYKYSSYNPYVSSWGGYTKFGAFKSTTNYPEAYNSYGDTNQWYKVTDRYSDHQGSLYWYRFEYYICTYTDYVISQ